MIEHRDLRWTLRAATAGDSVAIAEVWYQGWLDGHLGHVPEGLREHRRLEDFEPRVRKRLSDTTVAAIDSRVVGFVTVHNDEIEQLYVAESARGSGVAALLLGRGEKRIAARFDSAWLAVVPGNTRARRFYARNGWLDSGEIEYRAETAAGAFPVAARRYEKRLTSEAQSGEQRP